MARSGAPDVNSDSVDLVIVINTFEAAPAESAAMNGDRNRAVRTEISEFLNLSRHQKSAASCVVAAGASDGVGISNAGTDHT